MVSDAAPEWRWVPRFEHLLIDQTEMGAESVTGAVAARLLQIARGRVHRLRPQQQPRWTNPPRRGRPANRGHRRPARPTLRVETVRGSVTMPLPPNVLGSIQVRSAAGTGRVSGTGSVGALDVFQGTGFKAPARCSSSKTRTAPSRESLTNGTRAARAWRSPPSHWPSDSSSWPILVDLVDLVGVRGRRGGRCPW